MNNSYAFKLLIAIDMFVCAVIWRDSGITISSMTGLNLRRPTPSLWAKGLGWVLNHIQSGHCELAITHDISRAKAALVILNGN